MIFEKWYLKTLGDVLNELKSKSIAEPVLLGHWLDMVYLPPPGGIL